MEAPDDRLLVTVTSICQVNMSSKCTHTMYNGFRTMYVSYMCISYYISGTFTVSETSGKECIKINYM